MAKTSRNQQKQEEAPQARPEDEGLTVQELMERQKERGEVRDIAVHSPFTLSLTHDDQRKFGVGIHKGVPLALADHWYVKHHTTQDGEMPEAANTSAEPDTPVIQLIEAHRLASEERDRWREEAMASQQRAEQAEGRIAQLEGRIQQLEEQTKE